MNSAGASKQRNKYWCCGVQVQNETVRLHLVAALQSLHREGELLPTTQRDVLAAMLKEHGVTAMLYNTDVQTAQHSSFTGSSDGGSSGGHLVAGNQASPAIPRHTSNLARRPSDLGPPISGESASVILSYKSASWKREQAMHKHVVCAL